MSNTSHNAIQQYRSSPAGSEDAWLALLVMLTNACLQLAAVLYDSDVMVQKVVRMLFMCALTYAAWLWVEGYLR